MDVTHYQFYKNILSQPFVEEVWLFGSRARGDHQDRADIDLAVVCPKATERDWQIVQDIIENADTLLKIDCVRLDELDDTSNFKRQITTQGIKLYGKL